MTTIKVKFNLSNGKSDLDGHDEEHEFEVFDGLEGEVDDKGNEICDDCSDNGDDDDDWHYDGYEVTEYDDDDYPDPDGFDNLDTYAQFVELIDKLGEAYRLRYDDIGELTESAFNDSYNGCHESMAAYAESFFDDHYEIPDFLVGHVDWDSVAKDFGMDYSEYQGSEGVHIFRD